MTIIKLNTKEINLETKSGLFTGYKLIKAIKKHSTLLLFFDVLQLVTLEKEFCKRVWEIIKKQVVDISDYCGINNDKQIGFNSEFNGTPLIFVGEDLSIWLINNDTMKTVTIDVNELLSDKHYFIELIINKVKEISDESSNPLLKHLRGIINSERLIEAL